jgi:hypothetical protein
MRASLLHLAGCAALPLLIAVSASAAPKRALFDLTHAETAGNADWQIDTDQPLPLPDQSTVTMATPRTYWLGAISSWGIDLVKRGYEVATLTSAYGITYGNAGNPYDLSLFDVFIVPEPNTAFSAAESTAIFNYVGEGGGLVAVSDHINSDRDGDGIDSPRVWNKLDAQQLWGASFEVSGTNSNFTEVYATNVATAPDDSIIYGPNGVVNGLEFHNGTCLVLNPGINPTVRGSVWRNGQPQGNTAVMAGRSVYGNGRVFYIGDSSPVDDGSAVPGNSSIFDGWAEAAGGDSILAINGTIWATRRDPAVTAVEPGAGLSALGPIRPNPSRGDFRFAVTIGARLPVHVDVWDAAGRLVRRIAEGDRDAGRHELAWDGDDERGVPAPPGLYFLHARWGDAQATRRVVRLR